MTGRWYAECAEECGVATSGPGTVVLRSPRSGKDQMHRELSAAVGVVVLAALAAPAVSVTIDGRRTPSGAWML